MTHYQLENGYNIWTFQGNLRHHYTKSKFFQFLWRPRPASLLSKEKEKEIKKNLAEYSKRYQKEDDAFMLEHASGKTAEKREMREQWAALLRMRYETIHKVAVWLAVGTIVVIFSHCSAARRRGRSKLQRDENYVMVN